MQAMSSQFDTKQHRAKGGTPSVTVVVPTRDRPEYLRHTLAAVLNQRLDIGTYEVIVVDDTDSANRSNSPAASVVDELSGQINVSLRAIVPNGSGLNAARNTGIEAAGASLVVLTDDDVEPPPGWLEAVVAGSARYPDYEAFTGPIEPRLEGFRLPVCSPTESPVTSFDLGPDDCDTATAWGANLALRRSAYSRIGRFREDISGGGDEEEWERRLLAQGGRIRYLQDARLVHRRSAEDSKLRNLLRASYNRGKNMRIFDERFGRPPTRTQELLTACACLGHALRKRCAFGLTMAAHSFGRRRQASQSRRKRATDR